MSPWVIALNLMLNAAFRFWEKARQVGGKDKIPEWEDITNKNAILQAKIDQDKIDNP